MFLNKGKRNEVRNVFDESSRKYEYYKVKANGQISKGKTGTMPAKDAITGERLGIVDVTHPKVISGEWVHITKGKIVSEEAKKTQSIKMKGLGNSNSKYSDEELYESYKKTCIYYGKLVSLPFWGSYAEYNNLPYLKFFKKFRFNGRGVIGMIEDMKEEIQTKRLNIEIIENYINKEWRDFVKKEKNKWESK